MESGRVGGRQASSVRFGRDNDQNVFEMIFVYNYKVIAMHSDDCWAPTPLYVRSSLELKV